MDFDPHIIRKDFPILAREVHGKPLVYLDNAASAQKPVQVTGRMHAFSTKNIPMFTGACTICPMHQLRHLRAHAAPCRIFERGRDTQIIFTGGATDAINLVAHSYLEPRLKPGDEIILSQMEHHSNIVPWHFLRAQCGAVLKWVPVTDDGALDMEAYADMLGPRTKFVSLTQMSNALGTVTDAKTIIDLAHAKAFRFCWTGVRARCICRRMCRLWMSISMSFPDTRFTARRHWRFICQVGIAGGDAPYRGGGEMIREVSLDDVTYADPPHRFEAGTPPIVEAIGLGAALDYMMAIGGRIFARMKKRWPPMRWMLSAALTACGFSAPRPTRGDCVLHG